MLHYLGTLLLKRRCYHSFLSGFFTFGGFLWYEYMYGTKDTNFQLSCNFLPIFYPCHFLSSHQKLNAIKNLLSKDSASGFFLTQQRHLCIAHKKFALINNATSVIKSYLYILYIYQIKWKVFDFPKSRFVLNRVPTCSLLLFMSKPFTITTTIA